MTFACNATGTPTPSISWTKDDLSFSSSGDQRVSFTQQNAKLTVTNLSRADSGQYRCVANNSEGNATSNAAILNVQCKSIESLCFLSGALTEQF